MIEKYKHISLDLDGTLVYTVPEYRHQIVPQVVRQLNGKITDPFHIDRFWFEAGRDEIIASQFNLDPKKFWALFRDIDQPEKRALHTYAYKDAEPFLRKLKNLNKIVSIITGSPNWVADMEITKLNGAPLDYCLSLVDSSFCQKPDPRSLKFVMEKFGFQSNETVYIGNSNEDASYAKNAGVDFIYLERKEHNFEPNHSSVATIYSLEELCGVA